jgi:hypothetical protein
MADESTKSLTELFAHVKNILPEKFKKDAWYLIVVRGPRLFYFCEPFLFIAPRSSLTGQIVFEQASVLIGCGKPSEVGPLFTELVEGVDGSEEQRIKNRLSDVLMKEWTLVGVPLCVYAVTALGKAEQERRERLGFQIESPPESELAAFPEHRYVFVCTRL